jgi:hypothetical protein
MVPGVEQAARLGQPSNGLKIRYSIGFYSDTLIEIASGQGSLSALALSDWMA